jgi:hypothetical protein
MMGDERNEPTKGITAARGRFIVRDLYYRDVFG